MSALPIVERLRAVESAAADYNSEVTTNWYRNPDGPEAAALITELYEALDKLIEVCIEQGFAVGPHGRVAIGMDALRKARGEQ